MTEQEVSRIPEHAPKPQDRKKKKSAAARQAEADGFAIIEQCGMTLKIPVGEALPMDVLLLVQGDPEALVEYGIDPNDPDKSAKVNIASTKVMLGPEQWAKFRTKRPTLHDFNEIGRKLEEATGN